MKINNIKSPFNYHRCTGQQDWVHPYFVYPSPPRTSSNLHSAKLRPPTEDPPTSCWLGKPLLCFLLSMNLAPLSTFYERDCAVIVGCDWLTFSTVCRGPPCCVYKRFCSFRGAEACVQTQRSICLSHSSAPFGFYLLVDLFFSLCAHCTRCLSLICQWGFGLPQIWTTANLSGMKMIVHISFSDLVFKFWTNAQRQPCLVIL